jgi:hypothetical protein
MPEARKTPDPRLIALRDREQKERAKFERWYRRLKRAFTALEASRRALVRTQKRIRQLQEEPHP